MINVFVIWSYLIFLLYAYITSCRGKIWKRYYQKTYNVIEQEILLFTEDEKFYLWFYRGNRIITSNSNSITKWWSTTTNPTNFVLPIKLELSVQRSKRRWAGDTCNRRDTKPKLRFPLKLGFNHANYSFQLIQVTIILFHLNLTVKAPRIDISL